MTYGIPSGNSAMERRNKEKGFSLVELIVAVAIALVLMGFAIPVILSAMRNYTLSSASSNMTRLMQQARYAAIQRGGNSAVRQVVRGGRSFFAVDRDCDNAAGNTEQAYAIPLRVSLSNTGPATGNLIFSAPPTPVADPFVITFNARGNKIISCTNATASAAPSLIYVTDGSNTNAVTVSGAGRARGWRYDGSAWH